ncbi:MAG: hypothetical protein A3H59_01370 [Candidatus Jacksonbacteria bacterium RIFCSPLOWO2_02_FULL_43_9]|nr:MAG: hypothetical protein UV70_C0009G0031 [Parcubacteria group bacterium GW2011_GWA2_43_13]OGY69963.1 MAG: hypothetical protein A3B94_00910 [Candidatus Jacksonbacteria bacterium RIFCSPHIGHO2_02_FULL_43_10]OGY70815.1 MAG: hypothetical protein A2986_00505 [Candidatus Jacksonbacteria bacterium RIFCSPLOWO2_01_FULL_44_13]OGY73557.1 MAG: hypothetical protein A3H59_01370 [Candidatus Jacksonbacteria bacterium RIFCSPLOWO2_02_FULL_43_9]HAZ17104.1 hypothetical protein [Candidatus Jacksonbacteria bacter
MQKRHILFFSSLIAVAVLVHGVFVFAISNSALVDSVKSSFHHWNVMAQVALGETPVNARELCSQVNDSSSAIDISGRILGLTAAGIDPRTCAVDLIHALKSKVSQNHIGDPLLINDDIFAGLALISAGESVSDSAVQSALAIVKNNQQSNGSFGYAVGGGDDVDMTSAAVAFLRVAGSDTSSAVAYLKRKQNSDGGFPAYGQTMSNIYSSSWVAAFAQGQSWSNGGATLAQYLEKDTTTTSAAFRVIAEQGYAIPVHIIQPSQSNISSSGNAQENQTGTSIASNSQDFVYAKIVSDSFAECSASVSVTTPLQVVLDAGKKCGLDVVVVDTTLGKYVSAIGNKSASGTRGWMYAVNDRKGDVAAGEYRLMFGDKVMWFYGDAQERAPAFGSVSSTVSGAIATQSSVSLNVIVDIPQQVSVGGGGTVAHEARIELDDTSAFFGTLRRGEKTSVQVPVSNRGGVDLTIGAQVSGSDLFVQNLEINSAYWADFQSSLGVNEHKTLDVGVSVPSAYNRAGTHTGEMVIWGKARN